MATTQKGIEFNTPFTIFEKRPVPYYVPDLPKNLIREDLIGIARRAIANEFDLTIIPLDYYKTIKKFLTEEEATKKGFNNKSEYLRIFHKNCSIEKQRFIHAAKYQRKILDKEYGGKFPTQYSI